MKHSPAFLDLVESVLPRIREVTVSDVAEALARGEDFHLIDVREDHEWQAGHVEGAQHLGRGIIERDIENRIPEKDANIVLYCGGGYRSALAADNLQKMGYENVASMRGGFSTWKKEGLPLASPLNR